MKQQISEIVFPAPEGSKCRGQGMMFKSVFFQSQELMQKSQSELHTRSVKPSIMLQVTLPRVINQCISE